MSLPPLTLVPAGAGSGKTHKIQETLAEWVANGAVRPEAIVAVTFTEAAASELRERIRARLLEEGRVEDALRLDQAYISTIHGFGLRLLREFAFEAGRSPEPRLLSDYEQDTLLRIALAQTERADPVIDRLQAYGYGYDFVSKKGAETRFRDAVLESIGTLRDLGMRGPDEVRLAEARDWIAEPYGPTGDGARLTRALQSAAERLLAAFPYNLAAEYGRSDSARKELQADYTALRSAQRNPSRLEWDWKLWTQLAKLRKVKTKDLLPDGYLPLAEAVVEAAGALHTHPGPLASAQTHAEALLGSGMEALARFDRDKARSGLVDYPDMIAQAHRLLLDRPEVLATLVARIDCLVIDEFQDTNPIQFALLWQLHRGGVPALVVGDLKQAIMGFQGADPRLFQALVERHRDRVEPQRRNWRSQPDLMAIINALGPGFFGTDYHALEPMAASSPLPPLEVLNLAERISRQEDRYAACATSIGRRIRALLDDPEAKVVDRHSGEPRRLRGSDFAVLCPTHLQLAAYGDLLRTMGLQVRRAQDGWLQTREIQLALQALGYLANPGDRHAALYLAVTEFGSLELETALGQLLDSGRPGEPLLDRLDGLVERSAQTPTDALVREVLVELEFHDRVARWPEADQVRANLLRLEAEALEFVTSSREALASGGFHGSGLSTFFAWLVSKCELDDGNRQPAARVVDEHAVELCTWHAAKGREWPVVAVCGLDRKIEPRLPDLAIHYPDFGDLDRLLDAAALRYSPSFDAKETNERFLERLREGAGLEARRQLYVAVTRPRNRLIVEWPGYLEGKAGSTYLGLLQDAGVAVGEDRVTVGEAVFTCPVRAIGGLPAETDVSSASRVTRSTGRHAIERRDLPGPLTPDSITPSGLAAASEAGNALQHAITGLETVRYGGGLTVALGLDGAELGIALHRCFEILGARPSCRDRLAELVGHPWDESQVEAIASSVAAFEAWVAGRFAPRSVRREEPLLGLDPAGSVVNGTVDLLIETGNGVWILDHKSDQASDPGQRAGHYLPQLDAYAVVLEQAGMRVAGTGIHWTRTGTATLFARPGGRG